MYCRYCWKKLRPCKRIDFVGRRFHFTCREKEFKLQQEYQLELFVRWLIEHINRLDL